jgi:hypothetical protein
MPCRTKSCSRARQGLRRSSSGTHKSAEPRGCGGPGQRPADSGGAIPCAWSRPRGSAAILGARRATELTSRPGTHGRCRRLTRGRELCHRRGRKAPPLTTGHESRPVAVPPTLTTFWSLTEAKTVGLFSASIAVECCCSLLPHASHQKQCASRADLCCAATRYRFLARTTC